MRRTVQRHIIYFSVICLFLFFLRVFQITCPLRYLFGIPCPTCGITRAMLSLIRGDIRAFLSRSRCAVMPCRMAYHSPKAFQEKEADLRLFLQHPRRQSRLLFVKAFKLIKELPPMHFQERLRRLFFCLLHKRTNIQKKRVLHTFRQRAYAFSVRAFLMRQPLWRF